MGVLATFQVLPLSVDWKIPAAPGPPVPNQASPFPRAIRQVPLAAKAPSLESAGGATRRRQCTPPSSVANITNFPSTGSPTTIPCCASQNAIASQKPDASGLVN